jgi:hypothetical protein
VISAEVIGIVMITTLNVVVFLAIGYGRFKAPLICALSGAGVLLGRMVHIWKAKLDLGGRLLLLLLGFCVPPISGIAEDHAEF